MTVIVIALQTTTSIAEIVILVIRIMCVTITVLVWIGIQQEAFETQDAYQIHRRALAALIAISDR